MLKSSHLYRLLSISLRLGTLAAKLVLTLYMGRFLSLSEIGVYGLVFGAVMVMGGLLGFRLDYIVSREIVGTDITSVMGKMRDQAIFYMANYIVLGLGMALFSWLGIIGLSHKALFFIFALATLEGFSNLTYSNMNSLEQPVIANSLFFLRSGAWTFPVMTLGILSPAFRNADTVLAGWVGGALFSLFATAWTWRSLPWRETYHTPVNWGWITGGLRKCFPIWLGSIGIVLGYYVDRFVVMRFLGLDVVGIATFYLSFTNALLTLIQSGVLSFAYPRLITFHRNRDYTGFRKEMRNTLWQVAVYATVIAVAVGIAVPVLGYVFHKPELVEHKHALWLMLIGVWVRSCGEALYFILFAQHQDRPIWLGNLLFLIPAFGGNALFVPLCGLSGIGYGAIVSSLFLVLWRSWFILRPDTKHHDGLPESPESLAEAEG